MIKASKTGDSASGTSSPKILIWQWIAHFIFAKASSSAHYQIIDAIAVGSTTTIVVSNMGSLDFEKEKDNFRSYYDSNRELLLEPAADSFRNLIRNLCDEIPLESVVSRVKNREECIRKFERKYRRDLESENKHYEIKEHITDLIGIRVICLYETDIRRIRVILEKDLELIEVTDKIKDIESSDDRFGYKALHLDLKLTSDRCNLSEYRKFTDIQFEVQIRTIIQDAWSVLDHKLKYKKSIPASLKRRISRLAALFDIADHEFSGIKAETEKLEQESQERLEQESQENDSNEIINAFEFSTIIGRKFSSYRFDPYRVDGFVEEILDLNPDYKTREFQEALSNNFDCVSEYRKFQEDEYNNNLNPYTMVRHILYLADKEKFKDILYDQQKQSFEKWLNNNGGALG